MFWRLAERFIPFAMGVPRVVRRCLARVILVVSGLATLAPAAQAIVAAE